MDLYCEFDEPKIRALVLKVSSETINRTRENLREWGRVRRIRVKSAVKQKPLR